MNRLLALLFLSYLAGCAHPTSTEESAVTPEPAMRAMGESVTAEDVESDETIGFEIRRRLNATAPAATAGVVVEVNGGIVTLRGAATDTLSAWRAVADARSVKGVKEVYNQIIVTSAGP